MWNEDLCYSYGFIYFIQVALNMLREEGAASFYNGLGPSLIGIAPYIAVNFCVFDLWANYASAIPPFYCLIFEVDRKQILFYIKLGYIQGEEVFAGEVSKEDWSIPSNSFGISYNCHTDVLSFGHGEKANANEGCTLQDIFWCFSR